MAALWDDMLDEFRALGGTADNVCLKEGRFGRGLFPRDPSKPVKLHAPASLLVEVKHISFNGDDFRCNDDAPIGTRERAFLEAYQRDFSWGVSRGQTEALLTMMAEAPQGLRSLLDMPFNVERWLSGPTQAAVRERYFGTRAITYKGKRVLMPIIELVNHGPNATTYGRDDGISVSGTFDDEILVRYGFFNDAFDLFRGWGFPSEGQPFALSLQLSLETAGGEIIIGRGEVSTDPKHALFYPDVKIEGRHMRLSYLLLGHKNFPRLAKAVFYRIMRNAGRGDAEETFDRIAQANKLAFLNLMAASEQSVPQIGKLVRDVARIQLEAMSHAVGTREL